MEKALAAFLLSVLETITWIWGEGWWSHDAEEKIAWAITVITPIIVYFMPSSAERKWPS